MKRTFFILFSLVLLLTACGNSGNNNNGSQTPGDSLNQEPVIRQLEGDSTIYGLACDGSNDSIIVILRSVESDPDTIDILDARINRRVFGRPEIGDQVAITMNPGRKDVADIVINIDRLKGEWCYQVIPRLRRRIGAAADSAVQLPPDFPDSLRKKWFQPREYGFEIRRDNTMRPIGIQRNEVERQPGPVEYPPLKRYRQWHVYNGHLLLSEARRDTLGRQQIISTDTVDIVFMRRDTLQLRFADHEQGYYRRSN
ncbi:MAG: hypothetical protein J6T44_03080 [Prevotella sp.]|nr:hypothetical protein [Prevotella sp.]